MGDLNPPDAPHFLERDGTPRLAFRMRQGRAPAVLFLPGYPSDMLGAKAEALDAWAAADGRAFLRFDYAGTGESAGAADAVTLAQMRDDVLALVDETVGDLVLVGSSAGGWLMLLAALARPARVRALVGLAAAPDFTDWGFSQDEKMVILREGRLEKPAPHGDPELTTRAFWQSAEALRLLHAPIAFDGPVRLLHGEADRTVPAWVASRIAALVRSADVQTILVKDGDHRLSRPQDIALLTRTLDALMETL